MNQYQSYFFKNIGETVLDLLPFSIEYYIRVKIVKKTQKEQKIFKRF